MDLDIAIPTSDGRWVNEKHARIAEVIRDYNSELELVWIPPDKLEPGDMQYAVVHRPVGAPDYIVCYADTLDERLVQRVFSMDAAKHDVWSDMEAANAAVEALQLKKQMDEMEEAHELSYAIMHSPRHTYKHNGVTYQ